MPTSPGNYQPFDFTNTAWTTDQLLHSKIKVEHDPRDHTVRLLYKNAELPSNTKASKLLNWVSNISDFVASQAGSSTETPHAVAAAIDTLATYELVRQQANQPGKGTPQEKQASIESSLARCRVMINNLKAFDEVTKSYNASFIGGNQSFAACPTHEATIEKITHHVEKLQKQQQELEMKEMEEIIKMTSNAIADGFNVDRIFLATKFPGIERRLSAIKGEKREELEKMFYSIINHSYLETLLNQVQSGTVSIPYSIAFGLQSLGFPPELIKEKAELGAKQFATEFEKMAGDLKSDEILSQINPQELARRVQLRLMNFAATLLVGDDKIKHQRIVETLLLIHDFELASNADYVRTLQEAKLIVQEEAKGMVIDLPNLMALLKKNPNSTALVSKLLQTAFQPTPGKLDGDLLTIIDDDFQKRIALVTKKAQKVADERKGMLLNDILEHYMEIIANRSAYPSEEEIAKKESYESLLSFKFSQSDFDEQEIFGDGICWALNYRWIKELLKNPGKKFTSAKQMFEPTTETAAIANLDSLIEQMAGSKAFQLAVEKELLEQKKSESEESDEWKEDDDEMRRMKLEREKDLQKFGTIFHDRKQFAEMNIHKIPEVYQQYFEKGEINPFIPNTILTRDGLINCGLAKSFPDVKQMIDTLVEEDKKEPFLGRSNGIIDIEIFHVENGNFSEGHAIGMQIDKERHIFRFWDVNSGLYTCHNEEQLKTAFHNYMDIAHKGLYNLFYTAQYALA